jgi:ribosomal protein S18 acetylase RimI-like enzyme
VNDESVQVFLDLMRAHEAAVRPDIDDLTPEIIRADLSEPFVEPTQSGIWLADSVPILATMVRRDSAARNVTVDLYALPQAPAAVFAPAFDQAMEFARSVRRADANALTADQLGGKDSYEPDARVWQIQLFCREEDDRYRGFLADVGLRHVRNFYRMTVELDSSHDQLEIYPGLELVPALTPDLKAEIKRISMESFKEHWGSSDVERTLDEWVALRESGAGFSWERSWIVRVDGISAGLLINTDALLADDTDYVWTLGVLKPFRGKGVATWLLRKSFFDARQRGLAKVALNVDAENSTGAVHLYESVGMRPTEVYVAYRAPVEA